MLGCTEGAGKSPEVPQWPCLAYFKWCNLYFAELQSSIAHEPLLDKFGTSFPKRYLDIFMCVCFEFLCAEFQFAFPQLREHSPDHEPPGVFLGYPDPSSSLHNSPWVLEYMAVLQQQQLIYLHVLSQQMLFDSIKTNEEQHNIHNPLCKTVTLSVSSRYRSCHEHFIKHL